jgi:hypothetical protein
MIKPRNGHGFRKPARRQLVKSAKSCVAEFPNQRGKSEPPQHFWRFSAFGTVLE